MKINEVVNEGVLDTVKQAAGKAGSWLGHQASMSGMLGKNRQYQAIGTQLNKEREMASGAIKQKYLTDLANGLRGAEQAGLIAPTNPSTTEHYVLKFVNNLIRNYKQDPEFSNQLGQLAKKFSTNYTGSQRMGGKLPPEAEQIWAAIDSMRRASTSVKPEQQDFPPPTKDIKQPDLFTTKNAAYAYNTANKTWTAYNLNDQTKPTGKVYGPGKPEWQKLNNMFGAGSHL